MADRLAESCLQSLCEYCTNWKVFVTAEEDNKLKEKILEDNHITERIRETEHDQDEAKYSPEEKSVVEKGEIERTPTPSEDSEEDEGKIDYYCVSK